MKIAETKTDGTTELQFGNSYKFVKFEITLFTCPYAAIFSSDDTLFLIILYSKIAQSKEN